MFSRNNNLDELKTELDSVNNGTAKHPLKSEDTEAANKIIETGKKEKKKPAEINSELVSKNFRENVLKQGLSFSLVEPAATPSVSAFLGGSWDFGGPYVLFNKFDIDAIFNGSLYMLGVGLCLLPGIGRAACTAIGAVINAVTLIVNAAYKNPCGNRQLKVYLNGRNGGCA